MSRDTFDPTIYNRSNNRPMSSVLEKELSRRGILKGSAGLAALGLFSSLGLTGCNDGSSETAAEETPLTLGFDSIPGAKLDAVSVPAGYTARVLAPWGTPLNSSANDWQDDGSNTAEDQLNAVGMHHDGMHFFPLNDGKTEGLLCINHEYIDQGALHLDGATGEKEKVTIDGDDVYVMKTPAPAPAEEARKEINAHGVSVVHIKLMDGVWDVVTDSEYNKRYTAATEMDVSGPIADKGLLVTKFTEQQGNQNIARGTNNNCGNGYTPWGTYLTCEENWPGYFVRTVGDLTSQQDRIGLEERVTRYLWETPTDATPDEINSGYFSRFDVSETGADATEDFRNEAHGHGYIVEINPYDASSRAVKRTALGRFRHEDCTFGKVEEGKPLVVYSGHDGRFEYIYKFVSTELWDSADANPSDRLATGAKYLDEGTLYVARFDEAGEGTWIPLTPDSRLPNDELLGDQPGFDSLAKIILNTPGSAEALLCWP